MDYISGLKTMNAFRRSFYREQALKHRKLLEKEGFEIRENGKIEDYEHNHYTKEI